MGIDELIELVNIALEAGAWGEVSRLTVPLYQVMEAAGEMEAAELVQDLHWIANDALAFPLDVESAVVS